MRISFKNFIHVNFTSLPSSHVARENVLEWNPFASRSFSDLHIFTGFGMLMKTLLIRAEQMILLRAGDNS